MADGTQAHFELHMANIQEQDELGVKAWAVARGSHAPYHEKKNKKACINVT